MGVPSPSVAAFQRGGAWLLAAAFGLGVLIAFGMAWTAPDWLPLLPVVLLAGAGGVLLLRSPRLSFIVWLMGFPLLLSSDVGIQLQEAVYGLYFYGYLAYWYGRRLFLYRSPLVRGFEDRVALLWLVLGMVGGIGLGLLFGANPGRLQGEVLAFSVLSLYFPVKDYCVREKHGPLTVFLLVAWIGVFVTIDNVFVAQQRFAAATEVWQIADIRTGGRELALMFPLILTLAVLVGTRERKAVVGLLVVLAIISIGLVLSKSRTFWVTAMFCVMILSLLLPRLVRRRMLLYGLLGLATLSLIGFFVAGPYLILLVEGAKNRLMTLSGAATDISLVNRFQESAAVRTHIWKNPILGYGFGREYTYFRLIEHATLSYSYIHNGYLAVWYKMGLWGVLLVGSFWIRSAWCAFQAGRSPRLPLHERLLALGAAACLGGLILPAYTNSVFMEDEKLSAFTLVCAIGCGLYQRQRRAHEREGARLAPAPEAT